MPAIGGQDDVAQTDGVGLCSKKAIRIVKTVFRALAYERIGNETKRHRFRGHRAHRGRRKQPPFRTCDRDLLSGKRDRSIRFKSVRSRAEVGTRGQRADRIGARQQGIARGQKRVIARYQTTISGKPNAIACSQTRRLPTLQTGIPIDRCD